MPRLGYTKSRTGCLRCRQRRVKCDEKRPCSACTRHGVRCSLMDGSPTASSSTASPKEKASSGSISRQRSRRNAPATTVSSLRSSSTRTLLAYLSPATRQPLLSTSSPSPSTPPELSPTEPREIAWATDLELMHHFSTVTYLTLPRAFELARVWQTDAVQLSFSNDALLHQILAIAAFHLAYLTPDKRNTYSMLASQHQSDAARSLRNRLGGITLENCESMFAAASLLVISTFASLSVHQSEVNGPRPTLDDLADIFVLSRGMSAVIGVFETTVQTGRLGDLFKVTMTSPTPSAFLVALREKLLHVKDMISSYDDQGVATVVDNVATFISTIDLALATVTIPELRVVMMLASVFSEDFSTLIRNRNPMALTIISYYCAVLHRMGQMSWYVTGWGQAVANGLDNDVPAPWKEAMQWPLGYISGHIIP